uniref:MFS domain-containing protein n=1 Tax=Angiostrongylus cantonensis TaxID=6313 RepID=A0A0K0D8T8_ANGCA
MSYAVAPSANGNRVALLGGTIGAAVIFNLAVALITGNLSFTYFLLTLTYGGIAAAVMQLIFKNLNEKERGHVYQSALSCGFIIAKGTFFLLFGSYKQEVSN